MATNVTTLPGTLRKPNIISLLIGMILSGVGFKLVLACEVDKHINFDVEINFISN